MCDRGREGIVGVEGHERVLLDIANKLNRGGLVGWRRRDGDRGIVGSGGNHRDSTNQGDGNGGGEKNKRQDLDHYG